MITRRTSWIVKTLRDNENNLNQTKSSTNKTKVNGQKN